MRLACTWLLVDLPSTCLKKHSSDKIFGIKGEWVMIECMVDAHILSCNVLENVVNDNCFKQFVIQCYDMFNIDKIR